jgi:hypothetical protein
MKRAVQLGFACTNSRPARQRYLILHQTWILLLMLPAFVVAADFTFEIPPAPVAVDIGAQHIALAISGEVSASPMPPGAGEQTFPLNLRADLGGLQSHLTALMQQELNRSDRCGEKVSVQNATAAPSSGAADLTVRFHFERWICVASENNTPKRLLASDAAVHVIASAVLEKSAAGEQTVRMDARIGGIEADGPLGEMLRSGAVGNTLRDKVRDSLLLVLRRATNLDGTMPAQTRRFVAIQKIAFVDAGFGRLALDMSGRLQVPGESVSTVLEQFGNR